MAVFFYAYLRTVPESSGIIVIFPNLLQISCFSWGMRHLMIFGKQLYLILCWACLVLSRYP